MLRTLVDLLCSNPGEMALEVEGQFSEKKIYASVVSILASSVLTNQSGVPNSTSAEAIYTYCFKELCYSVLYELYDALEKNTKKK